MSDIITQDIIEKTEMVKTEIDKKLPGASKTLFILIWDDGDYNIEYRAAIKETLHRFTFHGSVDTEVQYSAKDELMLIKDEDGNEYWVDKDEFELCDTCAPEQINKQK